MGASWLLIRRSSALQSTESWPLVAELLPRKALPVYPDGYEHRSHERSVMGIVVLLLVLALLFGGVGLFVEGLKWVLIIALALLVIGAFTGYRGRTRV